MQIPTVFLYQIPPKKLSQLRVIGTQMKLRLRVVKPEEFGLPLGVLTGAMPKQDETAAGEETPFSDEMLVMAGLSPAQMDLFLNRLRRGKGTSVALKAVVTPTNETWNAYELHRELTAEHEAMQRGERAHDK